jgi:hypothetical protein
MRAPSLAAVTALIAGLLCHSAPAAERRPARTPRTAASAVSPVRLIPPLEGSEVATLGVESDGTRRLVAYGLRLLTRPDGSVEAAAEFFPLARNVSAVELPERLGRGFLFSLIASGRTSIWRAPSWTGPLEPFAELDFEIERLVPGFDRVYAQARRTGEWAALDPATGKALDIGSLPRSPNYGAMVFVDEWFGAVELPIRGTVVSFDAGNRWHRLELATLGLGRVGNELLVVTPEGRRALAADGTLRPLEGGGDNRADANEAPRRVSPEGPLGASPLRTALLRGFPDGPDHAIVAAQGAIGRVRLSDGRVLALREKVLSPSSSCVGIRLGKGFGFACGDPQGKTSVLAYEPPLAVRPVEEFETGRAISESGNGGLVIRGRCGPKARDNVPGVHCILTAAGERWELVPILNDRGVERVVVLSDGRAALLVPPRAGVQGSLVLASANGQSQSLPLKLASRDAASDILLKKGFWLDGFVEARDGSLRGWVTGQGVFAGVRIGLDGKVHPGPLQRSIERAVISGERALIVPATGIAAQSTDGGQSFTDADLPVEIEADPSKAAGSSNLEQGCSRLGCSFLGWLRVGWNGAAGSQPLAVAAQPKPTVLPSPGGGRWLLRCSPTGEVSPRIGAPALVRPRSVTEREDGQSSWLPLFEEPPPAIPKDAIAFDTGNEGQLRGYAWAPRGAEFGKTGKLTVAVADRYRIRDGVWTTRPAPSPWDDVALVSEVFGYEGSSPAVWNLTLDAGGRAGVLAISARGTTDLFAVEENRMAMLLVSASRNGIGTVLSTARLGTSYYVAAQEDGRNFRVFALESGRARLVGQYADVALGRTIAPTLVRSTRGDALGIWGRGAGWFVFPIDPQSGAVDRAIEVPARALASMPEPCAPDEEGYLLEGPVGIDPYADFVDGADEVSARGFEGRFVVSARGICLSELHARSEGVVESAIKSAKSGTSPLTASVPLVLADRASGGRRWGFRCSR